MGLTELWHGWNNYPVISSSPFLWKPSPPHYSIELSTDLRVIFKVPGPEIFCLCVGVQIPRLFNAFKCPFSSFLLDSWLWKEGPLRAFSRYCETFRSPRPSLAPSCLGLCLYSFQNIGWSSHHDISSWTAPCLSVVSVQVLLIHKI